jgi:hypothetical protein
MRHILFFVIILCSINSHAFDHERMKFKADSILANFVGKCIFEKYVSVDSLGNYSKPINKSELDSMIQIHWIKYNITVYDKIVQQITFSFNTCFELINSAVKTSFSKTISPRFEVKPITDNANCTIPSADSLKQIIKKNKMSNKGYKNKKAKIECINDSIDFNDLYLTEHGLTFQYNYESKARNKACIGEVLINVHTGQEIINRIYCYNF